MRSASLGCIGQRVPPRPATLLPCASTTLGRLFSSSGRSPADHLSDSLADANLLLNDLLDDDDRQSEDFLADLEEVQDAYKAVCDAYDGAIAALPENEHDGLRKNFDLAVVGLRDKLMSLEEEAGVR